MDPISLRLKRKVWTQLFGVETWISKTGDFRTKERYGLIDRPNYTYGLLRAADNAKYYGKRSVTVIELGVASGWGLLNMAERAQDITKETGVTFNIFGFDTGAGLPSVAGYKDHPEIWNEGDFAMEEREKLVAKIGGRAKIIWGDIAQTIGPFTSNLSSESPLGFVSVDVDIYSATRAGLRSFTADASKYLPAVSMYFDDLSFFTANPWCGEMAAINEFNEENELRKISPDMSFPGRRPVMMQPWYQSMYVCHILDHEARQKQQDRTSLSIGAHHEFILSNNI